MTLLYLYPLKERMDLERPMGWGLAVVRIGGAGRPGGQVAFQYSRLGLGFARATTVHRQHLLF